MTVSFSAVCVRAQVHACVRVCVPVHVCSLLALCACDPKCVCVCVGVCAHMILCVCVLFAMLCMNSLVIFIFFVCLYTTDLYNYGYLRSV